MNRKPWTKAELKIMRERYPHETASAIAADIGRSTSAVYMRAAELGLRKSAEFYASDKCTRIKRGQNYPRMIGTQFRAGLVPWNKGTHWVAGGRSAETRFKKGQMRGAAQRKYRPVGAERICRDGYLERKTTDAGGTNAERQRRWVGVHRLVWVAERGEVPPGHIVVFKRGMRTTVAAEITIDKLELITREENMRRNSYHNYPQPIPHLTQLRGVLNRKINKAMRKSA